MAPFLAHMEAWAFTTGCLPSVHPDWVSRSTPAGSLQAMLHPQDSNHQVPHQTFCNMLDKFRIWLGAKHIPCSVCQSVISQISHDVGQARLVGRSSCKFAHVTIRIPLRRRFRWDTCPPA